MTTAIRYTHVWIGVQTVLRALGQKQTFAVAKSHVRFTPKSGHVQCN